MGIFSRFAVRSLSRNRTRTIVSIVGIALSCALITAVLTSAVSMSRMLLSRTIADEGSWQIDFGNLTEEAYKRLNGSPDVASRVTIADLGTMYLGAKNAEDYGDFLFCRTWPNAKDNRDKDGNRIISEPELVSGRAPKKPGEIVLPNYLAGKTIDPCALSTSGPIEIGSEVSLRLGTATVTQTDTGESYVVNGLSGSHVDPAGRTVSFEKDLGTVEGTVVGFYRATSWASIAGLQGNLALIYDDGTQAERIIGDDSLATNVYADVTVADPQRYEEIADEISGATDAASKGAEVSGTGYSAHTSLLRWQGVHGDASIWNTLYMIAGIMAGVIMVAGISLVYNVFAISVSERTRQFGLLSSLGASKRQLRRSVITEALALALIGIPTGILLGLAGCFAVFNFTGTGLTAMFDLETTGAVAVAIEPIPLALSALLALIVVLISAWIPALRASRVSAVDAIRNTQDVKLSRRARRAMRKSERLNKGTSGSVRLSRKLGLSGKLFGIPGHLAHRNMTRAASKGRVTVAALAVSVALLVITGSLTNTLLYASDVAVEPMEGVDLEVLVDSTSQVLHDGSNETEGLSGLNVLGMREMMDDFAAKTADVDGAKNLGYEISCEANVLIPRDLLNQSVGERLFDQELANEDNTVLKGAFDYRLSDGGASSSMGMSFMDDASWKSYVNELGLSEEEFCDPGHPRAIVYNSYTERGGETYAQIEPFASTGTIEAFSFQDLENLNPFAVKDAGNGSDEVVCSRLDGTNGRSTVSLEEGIDARKEIEVGALADELPGGKDGDFPVILLPASALSNNDPYHYSFCSMDFSTDGDAGAAAEAQEKIELVAKGYPDLEFLYNNVAESKSQSRLMSQTIQIFLYCFSAITSTVAIANVFNTLSNSLILRRREFAVLKSVGMGNRAFRKMIAYECASFALKGFTIGMVLAIIVNVLLYQSMRLSFSTFQFTLPWAQVGIAAVVVLAVILASTAYALRKNRSSSIVESLREDAI